MADAQDSKKGEANATVSPNVRPTLVDGTHSKVDPVLESKNKKEPISIRLPPGMKWDMKLEKFKEQIEPVIQTGDTVPSFGMYAMDKKKGLEVRYSVDSFVVWNQPWKAGVIEWCFQHPELAPPKFMEIYREWTQNPKLFHVPWCIQCKKTLTPQNRVQTDRFLQSAVHHYKAHPHSKVQFISSKKEEDEDAHPMCDRCDRIWWKQDMIGVQSMCETNREHLTEYFHREKKYPVFWALYDQQKRLQDPCLNIVRGYERLRQEAMTLMASKWGVKEFNREALKSFCTLELMKNPLVSERSIRFLTNRLLYGNTPMVDLEEGKAEQRLADEVSIVAVVETSQLLSLFPDLTHGTSSETSSENESNLSIVGSGGSESLKTRGSEVTLTKEGVTETLDSKKNRGWELSFQKPKPKPDSKVEPEKKSIHPQTPIPVDPHGGQKSFPKSEKPPEKRKNKDPTLLPQTKAKKTPLSINHPSNAHPF